MKSDELKAAWQQMATSPQTNSDIQSMLLENRHPVLKKIRWQVIIEITGWSFFLLAYYTMFDAYKKPVSINLVLIATVLLSILHNTSVYRLARHPVNGTTLLDSVARYRSKLKRHALLAVCCRVVLMSGLLLFFTYGLPMNTARYLAGAGIISVFLIQLMILSKLWANRLARLGKDLQSLTEEIRKA